MDTMFVWIVAGAAIGLLGIFLVASERELRGKRQELDELKNRLADVPAPGNFNAPSNVYPQENGQSVELFARNEELLQQVSLLSKKLEASESKLEQLDTLRAHLNSKESEITELRWDRERLNAELANLKTPSESSELHFDDASQNSQKDAEITALKQQLEASQTTGRELESAPYQPADAESSQRAVEELQRSLEVSTLQLQNALAAEHEKQKELEAVQIQLSDLEKRHHELSQANLRLQEENSQHQQKLTNQNQLQVERLVIVRQRLEQLRSKQAEVSEQDRMIQEEIVSMSQLLDGIPEYADQPEPINTIHDDRHNILEFKKKDSEETDHADMVEEAPFERPAAQLQAFHNDGFDKSNGFSSEPQQYQSASLTAVPVGAPISSELSEAGREKKKRRFGIFSVAIAVLIAGGVLAASFLGEDGQQNSGSNPSGTAANLKSKPIPAVPIQNDGHSQDKTVRTPPAFPQAAPVESRSMKTSEKTTTDIAAAGKPVATAWESYEIVQPTRVFSAPSEHSQLIANVEPGTQVNVVDSRNGWLEIRSKHGRPPGFIQKTAAIRIGQN